MGNFQKWFKSPRFTSYAEYFEGDYKDTVDIIHLFGLDRDNLKPYTIDLLAEESEKDLIKEISNSYHSYLQFQDIFGMVMDEKSPNLLNRHYCYYESVVYFRESVVSWLDGNHLSSLVLIRPFLELSVLHLYWYTKCEAKSDYRDYYIWLGNTKNKPPFKVQVEYIFQQLKLKEKDSSKRLKTIKDLLLNIYRNNSAYHHSPSLKESVITLNGGNTTSYFGYNIFPSFLLLLIRQLIYLYLLVYPSALFPVDKYKKWGTGGPVGLFVDSTSYKIIENYIGDKNLEALRELVKDDLDLKSLISWYNNHPDLTEEELQADWRAWKEKSKSKLETNSHIKRVASAKSEVRALGWFLNYINDKNPVEGIDLQQSEKLNEWLKHWQVPNKLE